MAKTKTVFYCTECGYESAKWMGQCPGCRAWNTISEERIVVSAKGNKRPSTKEDIKLCTISEISLTQEDKISTGLAELDRVLGGGIVPGSLILVGGDPGIGKSTLLLQACRNLGEQGKGVLYISGEESLKQIKLRAERIGSFRDSVKLLCETNLSVIEEVIRKERKLSLAFGDIGFSRLFFRRIRIIQNIGDESLQNKLLCGEEFHLFGVVSVVEQGGLDSRHGACDPFLEETVVVRCKMVGIGGEVKVTVGAADLVCLYRFDFTYVVHKGGAAGACNAVVLMDVGFHILKGIFEGKCLCHGDRYTEILSEGTVAKNIGGNAFALCGSFDLLLHHG